MQRENQIQSKMFDVYFTDQDQLAESFEELTSMLSKILFILDTEFYFKFPSGVKMMNANLNIISGEEIKNINYEHRGKDKDTDVLSFPMQENIRSDDFESFNNQLELGDILISHDKCKQQAKEFNISYKEEFIHLFVHGLLHLYGYDHEIDEDEDKLMRGIENQILEKLAELKS